MFDFPLTMDERTNTFYFLGVDTETTCGLERNQSFVVMNYLDAKLILSCESKPLTLFP